MHTFMVKTPWLRAPSGCYLKLSCGTNTQCFVYSRLPATFEYNGGHLSVTELQWQRDDRQVPSSRGRGTDHVYFSLTPACRHGISMSIGIVRARIRRRRHFNHLPFANPCPRKPGQLDNCIVCTSLRMMVCRELPNPEIVKEGLTDCLFTAYCLRDLPFEMSLCRLTKLRHMERAGIASYSSYATTLIY